MLPTRDAELIQIVNAALADATRRALKLDSPDSPEGAASWLACRPGCTPCCHGVFRISALDADRLRTGLQSLTQTDPTRAAAIHTRALHLTQELATHFPGDPTTGELHPEDQAWVHFADLPQSDAPCPVLDPTTGRCELYASRPLTCRVFGPPVETETGIGLCELCYSGAPEAAILHGEMHLTHHPLEEALNQTYPPNETLIAWAVLPGMPISVKPPRQGERSSS